MTTALTYEAAREQLLQLVVKECERRALVYDSLTPRPKDAPEAQQAKTRSCILQLAVWAQDPVKFISDIGWAPDPQGHFGGGPNSKIPEALAPARMVPIILFKEQKRFVLEIVRIIRCDHRLHLNLLKSRQVAATTLVLLVILWCWLFMPNFKALLTSYEEDVIDGGGKWDREGDSLFARFRMMTDALFGCMPALRFNGHRSAKWKAEQLAKGNKCLTNESEDKKMRVVRPEWTYLQRRLYPKAKGNVITGKLPSDKFAKGDSYTLVLMDEFGEYDKLGAGIDKKARDAALPCCPHIITQGTIPEGGGLDSEFKTLCNKGQSITMVNLEIDWTDVAPYMLGAFYLCPHCTRRTTYGKPAPGPGPKGAEKTCEHCGKAHLATRDNPKDPHGASSPYFEMVKDDLNHDEVSIARYYRRDWYAALGDRAFYTFEKAKTLVPRPARLSGEDLWTPVDGYDPGWSEKNPAAWICGLFSERLQKIRLVGWHMAAHWRADKWVPFFKRISPDRLFSSVNPWLLTKGPDAGRPYRDVHTLRPEEVEMLRRVSGVPMGEYEADKYVAHENATGDSEWKILEQFGVHFHYEYTKDRGALIGKARDLWVPRMEIDPEIAGYRPVDPHGREYPTLVDCFMSARMVDTKSGQGQSKKDINKNEPWAVSHPIDAFLYLCRALPDEVEARANAAGQMVVAAHREPEPVFFGEVFEDQFA